MLQHKFATWVMGRLDPILLPRSRMPAWLPLDVLQHIYSYVFDDIKNYKILNPDCFPKPSKKDVKEVSLSHFFEEKVSKLKFFKQAKIEKDVKEVLFSDIHQKKYLR